MQGNKRWARQFTAETEYEWPATGNVIQKLRRFFDEATAERSHLKLEAGDR